MTALSSVQKRKHDRLQTDTQYFAEHAPLLIKDKDSGLLHTFKTRNQKNIFHSLFITYIFIISIFFDPFLDRYWYILIPSILVLYSEGIHFLLHIVQKKKWLFPVLVILIISFQMLYAWNNIEKTSVQLTMKNRYFLKLPPTCDLVTNILMKDNKKNMQTKIKLPYFMQAADSQLFYETTVHISKSVKYAYFSYVDDVADVYLNSQFIGTIHDPYNPTAFPVNLKKDQDVTLGLSVYNLKNIGGIGQILLCEKYPR